MNGRYKLDENGNAVEVKDLMEWANWLETANRSIGKDVVGDVRVSTVFLGLDYSFSGGVPVLWETMVFGGPLDGEEERYTSKEDALKGHAAMLERVKLAAQSPSSNSR